MGHYTSHFRIIIIQCTVCSTLHLSNRWSVIPTERWSRSLCHLVWMCCSVSVGEHRFEATSATWGSPIWLTKTLMSERWECIQIWITQECLNHPPPPSFWKVQQRVVLAFCGIYLHQCDAWLKQSPALNEDIQYIVKTLLFVMSFDHPSSSQQH
jgi:hypothetical protein